jgi:hypothetical protein
MAAGLAETMLTDTVPALALSAARGNWLPPADPSQDVSA